MAIALAEADKYEILEKIGRSPHVLCTLMIFSSLNTDVHQGCGSFGIIRKVKRKSDGFVSGLCMLMCDNPNSSRSYAARRSTISKCLRRSANSSRPNSIS